LSSATRTRVTLMPDAVAFEPGQVPMSDRTYDQGFAADGLLGEGGMGKVLAARDRKLGRRVAIKQLRAEARTRADLWGRFVREAQIGGQLEHPNIVPIYGFEFSPEGGPAFVMQLVDGESLASYIEAAQQAARDAGSTKVSPQKDRISKLLPVCDAIAYAHGRGVLHRDLKPDNVMLGAHNVVLVTDWGIARVESDEDGGEDRQTPVPSVDQVKAAFAASASGVSSTSATVAVDSDVASAAPTMALTTGDLEKPVSASGPVVTALGTVMGTPQYMSPEQALGLRLSAASDQYSLGLMLLELATLRTARSHEDASVAYGQAIAGQQCEHVGLDGAPLDPRLSAIIRKATAKAPEERYQNVDALASDIRAYMRGDELRVLPDSLARKLARHVAAHPGRAVATIAVVVLGLTLWALWGSMRAAERATLAKHDAESLSHLSSVVLEDAEGIQRYLTGLQEELVGLAHTTRIRLESERPSGQPPGKLTTPADLNEGRVPGLVRDPADGVLRSFREPVFLFLPGATAEAEEHAQRLLSGRGDLVQLYLSELDERALTQSSAEQQTLMAREHDGFVRLMVVLNSGAFMQFPGRGDFAEGYDPRTSSWYPDILARPGVQVSRPKFGPLGRIPRVALSHRAFAYGKVVGAVNGSIWLATLTALIGRQHSGGLDEAFIATSDGHVVASQALLRSVEKSPGEPDQMVGLPPISSAGLVRALAKQRGQGHLVEGASVYVFAKLGIEDWQLVHRYPRQRYLKLLR
jgi:serine/threonine protein kinase